MGSVRDLFGVRSGSVRDPFGVRLKSVRGAYGVPSGSLWGRSGSVRDPFGLRLGSFQGPFGIHLRSERKKLKSTCFEIFYETPLGFSVGSIISMHLCKFACFHWKLVLRNVTLIESLNIEESDVSKFHAGMRCNLEQVLAQYLCSGGYLCHYSMELN